jgi:hypothetical protein
VTTTLTHFPATFPRWKRLNHEPELTHLAVRVLPALFDRIVEPTARAIAERYKVNKDTACAALKSLQLFGLLHRWRRSAGRGVWLHFAVITDAPRSWESDPAVAEAMRLMESETFEEFRHAQRIDEDPLPEVPAPEPTDNFFSPVSCPKTPDIPLKVSPDKKITDEPVDKFTRPSVDNPVDNQAPVPATYTQKLVERFLGSPDLQPHVPDALAMLHGLGFSPLARVSYAKIVAEALYSGRRLGGLYKYLTHGLTGVRSTRNVLKWRLRRLEDVLRDEKRRREASARPLV